MFCLSRLHVDITQLNIRGGHCSGDTGYQVAIDMLSRRALPVEKIVSHALPLREIVSGLMMVSDPAGFNVKVTIDPTR
jgi:threonine dehydrogenase-like Zn-dependent dehydrogenase